MEGNCLVAKLLGFTTFLLNFLLQPNQYILKDDNLTMILDR